MRILDEMGLLYTSIKIVCASLGLIYVLVPLTIFIFPGIIRTLVFMSFARDPFSGYTDLQFLGIESRGRNFYISSHNAKIGVWHILPNSLNSSSWSAPDEHLETVLFSEARSTEPHPVIVYCHGNGGSRRATHRVDLINLFTKQDYHAVAFDYRGYADSTGEVSEENMINDVIKVVAHLRERIGEDTPLLLWGHSLGTAIASAASARLCKWNKCPTGLVLESGFNNLHDILKNHPFTYMYRKLPFFERLFIKPVRQAGMVMNTDERLRDIKVPVLMLHAHDDHVVPFHLATKLHESALKYSVDTTFVDFKATRQYGHKYIHKAPELPDIIYEFLKKCVTAAH